MTTNYNSKSLYSTTSQTSWFLEEWKYIKIPNDSTDNFIVLSGKYKFRPDLLAYDTYGSVEYWWVFMIVNSNLLFDPIFDMIPGITLRVPTSTRLKTLVG